jgi:outer membrane protein insertion porin family
VRPPALLLVPLLLGVAAAAAQDAGAGDYEGRPIGRIEFDPSDQPLPRAELDRLLGIGAGSTLTLAAIRESIQNLYRTGRFSDISIDARLEADAVVLRISTQFNYFVSQVTIDGVADPPNRGQLTTAAKLDLGAGFAENDLEQSVENMQVRLRANGLYRARITYRVERNPATEEASIHFQIDAGDRARFDGARLSGNFDKPAASVIRATRWRRGIGPIVFPGWRELTENRLQTGIERVRQDFQTGDHLQARVTLERLDYHERTNTVTPALAIQGGPAIEVRTSGAKVSPGRLRQLIPIYQERTVDRNLLVEGQRNLVEYFQSQGYYDADVELAEPEPAGDVQVIDYSVTRKTRHRLTHIDITGNRFFDTATLRERLSITPASFPRYRSGRFSEKLLEQDKNAIRDLYRANGFRDAEVTSKIQDNYRGQQDYISVSFEVREGPQWFVDKLEIEGVSPEDAAYLRSTLQSTDGQSFSDAGVAADRDTTLSYYYNNGYPGANFDWTETPGSGPNRVNLRYSIRPGKREFVRGVLVRGLDATSPALVTERISLKPGDALSQSRIAESQQKLYDLGIFSKVQPAIQNPDGEEENKNVVWQLDEANKYSFNVGFGAELARIGGGVTTFDAPAGQTGFSPRISLGISRLNLLGLGHTLGLQTLASTFEQRALLSYTAPQFTGKENLALTFSALFDDSRDVRTFAARREEGSVQLAQRLSRANTVQYRFTFRRVTVDLNTLKISPELIPLLSQPDRVGMYSMSFIQDRRDDATNTSRGVFNTVDAGISLRQFGSETDFTRILLRNSTYHRIRKDLVIARTLQFGWVQRLSGMPGIALAERFFSGGASSQRAFPDNQAGPRDLETGFPLGGNALLFHQTELRFPLIGDNVGGVLFHDMGNVYDDVRHISFRFLQNNKQDFNYMVQAAGFGIRYRTPVGPIRVDFSLSPNSPRFYGFQGTRDELLMNQGKLTDQRINIFQFHFSLGQTF